MAIETKHTYICDCCKQRFDSPLLFGFRVERHFKGKPTSSASIFVDDFEWGSGGAIVTVKPPERDGWGSTSGGYCSVQCATEGFRTWLLLPNPTEKKEKTGLFGRRKK